MSKGTILVFWLVLATATCNYTNILWEHRCEAGSTVFACSIPEFLYIPSKNSSSVIEPDSTVMRRLSIRVNHRKRGPIRLDILAYDAALHNQLKRPRAVQVTETRMKVVEIPIDLEYGDFSWGNVNSVVAPPSETAYPLRFLDLQHNFFSDIRNLSTLVNLETLMLQSNRLIRIPKQVFQHMTNLTTLVVSMNGIFELSFSLFPPRLERLFAQLNGLQRVDFSDANLPALEMLSLSYGFLTELDVPAVLAAAPKLKEIKLLRNDFGLEEEMRISAALNAAGIAHENGFGMEKTDEPDHRRYDDDDDDDDDDSFYRDRKAQFWEHTFAWLLAVGNVIVIVWAVVDYYKGKQQEN